MIAIYHRSFVILLKSNILPSSCFKPCLPRLRDVSIEANAIGVTVRRAMYRVPIIAQAERVLMTAAMEPFQDRLNGTTE